MLKLLTIVYIAHLWHGFSKKTPQIAKARQEIRHQQLEHLAQVMKGIYNIRNEQTFIDAEDLIKKT